jgi:hypothetical protein
VLQLREWALGVGSERQKETASKQLTAKEGGRENDRLGEYGAHAACDPRNKRQKDKKTKRQKDKKTKRQKDKKTKDWYGVTE